MATRHRIPSIFNLSMVDVLCCALGCVILLWLLNLRQAKQSGSELTTTQQALADKKEEAKYLADRLQRTQEDLDRSKEQLTGLQSDLARLNQMNTGLTAEVIRKTKLSSTQAKELASLQERSNDLGDLLKKKEAALADSARNLRELKSLLDDAEAQSKKFRNRTDTLEKELDSRGRDLASRAKTLQELDTLRVKLMRDLDLRDRDLAAANLALERARNDKISLVKETGRLRTEMDSRFAGIALTGKRVVFLVDMSGSMELVDPRTSDPSKWVGVRETLTKVMKSLPGLEKYQVILFSDRVLYPLGKEGEWLTYEGASSADQVLKTLAEARFKPKGGTNMYAAFDAAFRLRATGLDTIYLLSDGLPNQGEGITAEQKANLGEIEKGEILGKYIRKMLANDWNRAIEGKNKVRINAIGFFYESPDVGAFLWALARENDGSFVGMSKP